MSGKRLIDAHLNGGTYNLGIAIPRSSRRSTVAMQHFDIGNHHFPSLARTALAEAPGHLGPGRLTKVIYGSEGARPSTSR
jgi:acetylornithine/succinyldiaminopimelate/putrescine aminotransferase